MMNVVLIQVLLGTECNDAIVGNASLCISEIANVDESLATLRKLDAVNSLIDIAHKRTPVAQKNAAIACARLAKDPQCLERLRELHGIEIIYRYVKAQTKCNSKGTEYLVTNM